MRPRPRRAVRRLPIAAAAIAALALTVPASSQAAFGPLSPVSLTTNGNGGRALAEATAVALSPNGKNAYVASQSGDYSSTDDSGVASFARDTSGGGLSQLSGTAGCATTTGNDGTSASSNTCATANGVRGAKAVAVSPDGKFVYVGASETSDIAIFSRDASTGALSQAAGTAGCIGAGAAPCGGGAPRLGDLTDLKISSDGKFLYATAGNTTSGLSVFSRDVGTGALTQIQCKQYRPHGTSPSSGCTVARAMLEPESLAFSPDGKQLYVAASEGGSAPAPFDKNGAVVTFNVDTTTGLLSQPADATGCINASGTDNTTVAGTPCATGRALHDAHSIAVSPDGNSVYVAAQGEVNPGAGGALGAVDLFTRNPSTGTITQLAGTTGCITQDGSDGYTGPGSVGTCSTGRALAEPSGVAVSPDGQSVYLAASDPSSSLDVFTRDPATSGLTQVAGAGGCLSEDGGDGSAHTCAQVAGLGGANGLAVASGSTTATCGFVYLAAQDRASVVSFARQPDCTVPVPPQVGPLVVTGAATAIGLHGATLNGTVNPRGSATTYRFDYGLSTSYTAQTLPISAGAGNAAIPESTIISGLQDGLVYHYRIEATNSAGTSVGQDMTFTTALPPRIKPRALTVTIKPKHPRVFPFALTVSGRLVLPAGVNAAQVCSGVVSIQVKRGKLTISTRRVNLARTCTYKSKVKFNVRGRLGRRGRLKAVVHYLGNPTLAPTQGPTKSVPFG